MKLHGHCHCGAISYEMPQEVVYHALCNCRDCRRHAGAPLVAWALVPRAALVIHGEPRSYSSSENGRRHFCPQCGTGLFYTNEVVFPGMIDVQSCTLDDPEVLAPQMQVQTAEKLGWMVNLHALPEFERYPA
jgi:hypothetical protein